MSEGRAAAMQVVERALSEQVDLMVALHYLGMMAPDALAPLKEIAAAAPIVERMAAIPAAPIGRQEIIAQQRQRREQIRARRAATSDVQPPGDVLAPPLVYGAVSHRVGGTGSLFARWVDGEIAWSPAVMGWDEDDARVEQARELGLYD
jgi:hypothetical protein